MFVNREEIPVYPVYRDPVSCYFVMIVVKFDLNYKNHLCNMKYHNMHIQEF